MTRQANHDLPPASIYPFAARNFSFLFIHLLFYPELSHSGTPIQPDNYHHSCVHKFALNLQIHSKWHQRQQRRSPPLEARLLQERLPLRRRKLARKPPPLQATRRSATRREKRRTRHTSTKVSSLPRFEHRSRLGSNAVALTHSCNVIHTLTNIVRLSLRC